MGRFDDEDDLSDDLSSVDDGENGAAPARPRLSMAERSALLDDLEVKVRS
jgi:hypothetical protein